MNTEAASARPMKNQRCQPAEPARNENAAPVLCQRTTLKNEVTVRLSPRAKPPAISCLANWSSSTTTTAMPSQIHSEGALPEDEREGGRAMGTQKAVQGAREARKGATLAA